MIVVYDTREQMPWNFFNDDIVKSTEKIKLNEGDYTSMEILELERATGRKILRIERKASTAELALNLGKNRKTFEKELARLAVYEYKYLLFEFDEDDVYLFPKNSGIPANKLYKTNAQGKRVRALKMNGPYMIKILADLKRQYGIEIVYGYNREKAKEIAIRLMNADFKEAPQQS